MSPRSRLRKGRSTALFLHSSKLFVEEARFQGLVNEVPLPGNTECLPKPVFFIRIEFLAKVIATPLKDYISRSFWKVGVAAGGICGQWKCSSVLFPHPLPFLSFSVLPLEMRI